MSGLLEDLRSDRGRRVVHVRVEYPKPPREGPRVEDLGLPESLVSALRSRGITRLYEFQAKAISLIRTGRNVSIVAGTGTGKTEAFLIPILEEVMKNPYSTEVKALIIYPTKALARDQLKRINYYTAFAFGARAAVLDGDTPERERRAIYSMPPHIIITNPDMVHMSLQHSRDFRRMVSTVKYVVFDDAHVYSGVFGAHVAYVIKRLKRFVRDAVFIAASATLGNPKEFAETLFGETVDVVNAGTTRKGTTLHVLIRPTSRSKISETLKLLELCIKRNLKTLVFVDSHRLAELIKVSADRAGLRVGIHRAGLRPEERYRVEEALRTGTLEAVISTPTLELGIDIGDLDAVILYSIPPTYSKYVQRIGRVGRRGQVSYVLTILGDDPISSYYERNPREFFERKFEERVLEPENEEIAKVHLLAMARDSPYSLDELNSFEREIASWLLSKGYLRIRRGLLVITREGARFLSERQSLRGVGKVVRIVTKSGRTIGFRELPMALKELHPGAVYLHGGRPYLSLYLERGKAVVEPLPPDYPFLTKPLYYSEPDLIKAHAQRIYKGFVLQYISLSIRDSVYGYVVRKYPSMEPIREVLLEKEYAHSFRTKGLLIWTPPSDTFDEWSNAEAFHAIEHALISAAEIVTGASPTDLGGISFPSGHIYIYDAFPGGSGLSKEIYKRFEEIVWKAFDIIHSCSCRDGCPRCIFSPYCGNNNKLLSRRKAEEILSVSVKVQEPLAPVISRYGKPVV